MKEGVLLEEEITAEEEEAVDEGQGAAKQDNNTCVEACFVFIFFLLCWNLAA